MSKPNQSDKWIRDWVKNPELDHWVESFEGGLPESKYPNRRLHDDKYMVRGLTTAQRLKFYRETCWIHSWYSRLLIRQFRGASGRLSIDYVPSNLRREIPYPAGLCLPFDLVCYRKCNDLERRQILATTLRDGLLWWAKKLKQDASPVRTAYKTIKEANYCYTGEFNNRFLSPDKKIQARVAFDYGPKGMALSAVFMKPRSSTVLYRVPVGRQVPHAWLIFSAPKRSKWKGKIFHIEFTDWKGQADAKNAYAALKK